MKDLHADPLTVDALHPAACTGCHACVSACPVRCIRMKPDRDGFLYPEIDENACIGCGKCAKACPVLSKNTSRSGALQEGYAACSRDETIRRRSSSGGVFTHLAERILEEDGAVAGAVMSKDCRSVYHTVICSKEGLTRLRGSKYVQSRIGGTFEKVRRILETGRPVLFSGTPCQVGGLYGFLGKEYGNLYTVDIVCHGVPAPCVWDQYVSYREQEAGGHAVRTFFRDKKNGWRDYALRMEFDSRKRYYRRAKRDPYMRGYLADLYLRPCCHDCAFKTADRQSDLTLADFWGIREAAPSMDDDLGVSFVWVHSPKGQELLDRISGNLRLQRTDVGQALAHNPAALHSADRTARSADFHSRMNSMRSCGPDGTEPGGKDPAGSAGPDGAEPERKDPAGSGRPGMSKPSADQLVKCIADCCREPFPQRIRREILDLLSGVKRWMK